MTTYRASIVINRSVADVFRFVGTNYCENHPKWAPHVVEVRMDSRGALAAGARGHVVRRDGRKRATYEFEVADFKLEERIAISAKGGPADFSAAYAVTPAGEGQTKLDIEFILKMKGLMGLIQPLMARMFRKEVDRVGKSIKAMLEG